MIPRQDIEVINLLHQPKSNSCSRELAILNSLLVFVQKAPGNGWLMYEFYLNITPHVFSNSIGNDDLRHSILSNDHYYPRYVPSAGAEFTLL